MNGNGYRPLFVLLYSLRLKDITRCDIFTQGVANRPCTVGGYPLRKEVVLMTVLDFITIVGYTLTVFELGYMIGSRKK